MRVLLVESRRVYPRTKTHESDVHIGYRWACFTVQKFKLCQISLYGRLHSLRFLWNYLVHCFNYWDYFLSLNMSSHTTLHTLGRSNILLLACVNSWSFEAQAVRLSFVVNSEDLHFSVGETQPLSLEVLHSQSKKTGAFEYGDGLLTQRLWLRKSVFLLD